MIYGLIVYGLLCWAAFAVVIGAIKGRRRPAVPFNPVVDSRDHDHVPRQPIEYVFRRSYRFVSASIDDTPNGTALVLTLEDADRCLYRISINSVETDSLERVQVAIENYWEARVGTC